MNPKLAQTSRSTPAEPPWWRHPMVWLVIGGPAIVVVAAIGTAFIAVRGADPVVTEPAASAGAERPAIQARNQGMAPTAARH